VPNSVVLASGIGKLDTPPNRLREHSKHIINKERGLTMGTTETSEEAAPRMARVSKYPDASGILSRLDW